VAYWILIPATLGFMLFHHAIDFFRKMIGGSHVVHSGEKVQRLNLHFRIAHWLVMVSFPVLILTGFALKFPEAWWAAPLLNWEGQFAFRGTVHRTAGVILIIALVYHIIHLIASRRDRILVKLMIPGYEDALVAWGMIRYNLGLSKQRPIFGAVNYAEKMEYWAFLWGTVVMAASGFLLWFNNFTLRNFPKWVSDAAEVLHYYEAILATFAILIWHLYIVMFDPDVYPMDFSWLTGKTSADHLRHTRPEYYLDLTMRMASEKAAVQAEGPPGGAISGAPSHDAAPDSTASAQPAKGEESPGPNDGSKDGPASG
jgi:formate dehydrogenase gamma subunit